MVRHSRLTKRSQTGRQGFTEENTRARTTIDAHLMRDRCVCFIHLRRILCLSGVDLLSNDLAASFSSETVKESKIISMRENITCFELSGKALLKDIVRERCKWRVKLCFSKLNMPRKDFVVRRKRHTN